MILGSTFRPRYFENKEKRLIFANHEKTKTSLIRNELGKEYRVSQNTIPSSKKAWKRAPHNAPSPHPDPSGSSPPAEPVVALSLKKLGAFLPSHQNYGIISEFSDIFSINSSIIFIIFPDLVFIDSGTFLIISDDFEKMVVFPNKIGSK